jgi:DNA-directed RNA polymerase
MDSAMRTVAVAQQFKGETFWMPWSIDFRGRVYPIPAHLSVQGNDLHKALLMFADGKPLGSEGASWLALHGANTLGETPDKVKLTKQTLQARIDWIVANSERIIAVANDPWGDLWWTEADSPLCFFAFCCEWAGYVAAHARGEGEQYVCALPVSADGTCSGLQHYSALLRHRETAEAVNVAPAERPQDIYNRVSEMVTRRLEELASDDELARLWLSSGLVNRSLAKRPTMTFVYGSKKHGFKKQLREYLEKDAKWETTKAHFTKTVVEDGEEKEKVLVPVACALMARLIWDALNEIATAAFRAMDFLQAAARGVVKAGKYVEWTVPCTGLKVRQHYANLKPRQIRTILAGKIIRPAVFDELGPDPIRQANAIAPNFIHSLDAAALMLTVNMANAEGVEHFAMVHDSYGTLPADAGTLASCTRRAFVHLYTSTNVLDVFAESLRAEWEKPERFPEVPAVGDFDLGEVLRSDYFFS